MKINIIKERKRLENIKSQLENLQEEQKEAEAEKRIILKKLKEEFDCSSFDEAKVFLEEMEEEIEEMEEELKDKIDKIISDMKEEGLT